MPFCNELYKVFPQTHYCAGCSLKLAERVQLSLDTSLALIHLEYLLLCFPLPNTIALGGQWHPEHWLLYDHKRLLYLRDCIWQIHTRVSQINNESIQQLKEILLIVWVTKQVPCVIIITNSLRLRTVKGITLISYFLMCYSAFSFCILSISSFTMLSLLWNSYLDIVVWISPSTELTNPN